MSRHDVRRPSAGSLDRRRVGRVHGVLAVVVTILGSVGATPAAAQAAEAAPRSRFFVSVEGDLSWQSRNDVRIPGDTGTKFSLADFGHGPFPTFRFYAGHVWNGRHEVRLLAAPLALDLNGTFDAPVSFEGETFAADTPTAAYYRFSSYRATYAYHFRPLAGWRLSAGLTAKLRDAEVRLEQAGRRESKTILGFVPLLNVRAARDLGAQWTLRFDLDGLAAPQGRAFDGSLLFERPVYRGADGRTLHLFTGYRTVEGGADNDEVYTFAWLHKAVLGLRAEF